MPINATRKGTDRGSSAEIICDCCGHTALVRADYERTTAGVFKVNEGQVIQKATHQGWSYIKRVLRCAVCETERRTKKEETTVTKKTDNVVAITPVQEEPRQPSREQKRQIISLLGEVYDTKAGRYTGGETDKTVADAIGGGVMFGWVAQIREDLFGPDGNEELEALSAELVEWGEKASVLAKNCHDDIQKALASLREYNKLRDALPTLSARVDALKAAIGPRARNV